MIVTDPETKAKKEAILPPGSDELTEFKERLNLARYDLLDLGPRNPLIRCPTGTSRLLMALSPSSSDIWKWLVTDGRGLSVQPHPSGKPASYGDELLGGESPSQERTPRRTVFLAGSDGESFDRSLRRIKRAGASYQEERGTNPVRFAFGVLDWCDLQHRPASSPLLLAPVALSGRAKSRFDVEMTGASVEVNPALIHLLRRDFSLQLPALTDVAGVTPDAYLDLVNKLLEDHGIRWVTRPLALLGLFSSASYMMFDDLDPDKWLDSFDPEAASVISSLLGDGYGHGHTGARRGTVAQYQHPGAWHEPTAYGREERQGVAMGADSSRQHICNVLDADDSQREALSTAMAEPMSYIQGPPGTGKSQTVANLMASEVARGGRVLFVTAKSAARSAIIDRLARVGLQDLYLVLDPATTNACICSDLLGTIENDHQVFENSPSRNELLETVNNLHARSDAYNSALHSPIGRSGLTPYTAAAIWLEKHLSNVYEEVSMPHLAALSDREFDECLHLATNLEDCAIVLGCIPREHPLFGIRRTAWLPSHTGRIIDMLTNAVDATLGLQRLIQEAEATKKVAPNRDINHSILEAARSSAAVFRSVTSRWRGEFRHFIEWQQAALLEVVAFLEVDEPTLEKQPLTSQLLDRQIELLRRWMVHIDDMPHWSAFLGAARRCREAGMSELVEDVLGASPAKEICIRSNNARITRLLDLALATRRNLGEFSAQHYEQNLRDLDTTERLLLLANRDHVNAVHGERIEQARANSEMAHLRRLLASRSRRPSFRQLTLQCGEVVTTVKPVIMTSPAGVAQFLPAGRRLFDLVIFDEASQLRPSEALGSILRGRRIVVVGDHQQLPPSNFFHRMVAGDEECDFRSSVTSNIDSILDLCRAQGAPETTLTWHYRSRKPGLIAVSNDLFYGNRLIALPNHSVHDTGLAFHHVPSGEYDRGRTRVNKREAEIVAAAVARHAKENPWLSLGVATLAKPQAEAIQDLVEELEVADPTVGAFLAVHSQEPFFVKPLEMVQGDERDVIFVSVGYAPTADGQMAGTFGPLNQAGGDRRVNVLMTRARITCEVFSSLRSSQIPNRKRSAGLRALATFLERAEHDSVRPLLRKATHTLEPTIQTYVADAVKERGFEIKEIPASIGGIQLGIVDPEDPSTHVLGLVTDSYSSTDGAASSRDYSLGRRVLATNGWRTARLWTIEWLRDPERECERVVETIREAQRLRSSGFRETVTSRP